MTRCRHTWRITRRERIGKRPLARVCTRCGETQRFVDPRWVASGPPPGSRMHKPPA